MTPGFVFVVVVVVFLVCLLKQRKKEKNLANIRHLYGTFGQYILNGYVRQKKSTPGENYTVASICEW